MEKHFHNEFPMDQDEMKAMLQKFRESKIQGKTNAPGIPVNPFDEPVLGKMKTWLPPKVGKSTTAPLLACCGIPIIIALVLVGLVVNFLYGDQIFPDSIHGHVVDVVAIPGNNGTDKLWIRTDDSFYYTNRVETPGSLSISTESLFNKTYDYIYDPAAKKIIYKNKTEWPHTPPKSRLFLYNGKVWDVNGDDDNNNPGINTFDPATGRKTMDTTAFIAKWPQLQSGIAKMYVHTNPDYLDITANDGHKAVFYLADEKMYKTTTEHDDALAAESGNMTVYTLGGDNNRYELYKITGPKSKLTGETIIPSAPGNPDTMNSFYQATSTALTPGQFYLDGIILYSDPDYVLIVHQSSLGKDAERLLTCVSGDGKNLWTMHQEQMLPHMRYSSSDSFSDIFFVKDDFGAQRVNDLFLFKMKDVGVMGIDLPMGNVKWTFSQ